jgi:hypothetical protein
MVAVRNPDMFVVVKPGVGVPFVMPLSENWANAGFASSNNAAIARPLVNLRMVRLPRFEKNLCVQLEEAEE